MKKLDICHRIPDSLCEITKQIAIGTFLIKKKSESNNSISHFNPSLRFSDTNDQNFGV